ncbi:MAG: nitroreductase family protein [Acidobacteriota bacterium]
MTLRLKPLVFPTVDEDQVVQRAVAFHALMAQRRTVRDYDTRHVPRAAIDAAIAAAGTAPSGANLQPWHFVAISRDDRRLRARIRAAAEEEEREFYTHRAPKEWLEALAPLGTDWRKPFLEEAPWLIAVFVKPHGVNPDGTPMKHYYAVESVGIATGLLITALHQSGLATLTHTPSPMGFLNTLLGRPPIERPFLLLVVGHPARDAQVPDIQRKKLDEIATWM